MSSPDGCPPMERRSTMRLSAKADLYFDSNDGYDDGFSTAVPLKEAPNPLSNPSGPSVTSAKAMVQSFLQTVPHLFTLSLDQIKTLDVMVREYGEMNVVVEEGAILQHIYILASGTVEVMNSKKGLQRAFGHRRIGSITAPNVFGIDDAILESPTEFTYHASSKSTLLLIPKAQFIRLFSKSAVFANSVSSRILQTLPAFSVFQDFCRSLFGLSSASYDGTRGRQNEGYRLSLAGLVDIYKQSGTVFHKNIHANEIDAEALHYCVRRLPSNITQTYILILTSSLPDYISNEFLADAATSARSGAGPSTVAVDTGKRRRCAWAFGGGGQTVVMMRDGFTDTIDFVSNLCMLTVEARKISRRLQQLVAPSAEEILRDALEREQSGQDVSYVLDELLPFTDSEVEALRDAWGRDVLSELYRLLLHREEYVVQMEPTNTRRFAQDAYASWSMTLMGHIRAAMGLADEEDELPTDIVIDVLFSPNRTLKNLFCSMSSDLKDLIAYEPTHHQDGEATPAGAWKNEEDRYYYVLTGLLERDETVRDAYRARLESNGFTLMEDAHSSALIVDLIDVSKICVDDVDSSLRPCAEAAKKSSLSGKRHFIINVDKTFGGQIESVLRSLLLTFGDRIRSANLTGKAAGLTGNRGDVVLPSKLVFSKRSFGEDSTDEVRLCNYNSLTHEDITLFFGKSSSATIHSGSCITFPGFVLQSSPVLRFYGTVHGCTAVDMQSSYVARQIEECRRTGVLSHSIPSRYLFYFDDMPLGNENGLRLKPQKREIISTIYASARSLLCQVLASS